MQRVFVMYNLKPGVTMDEYKKWSRDVDQKVMPNQPGIHSFDVFEIKGADKDSSPYQIVEDVIVDSWEAWQKVVSSEAIKELGKEWPGDADSAVIIYGDQIEPN